MKDEVVTVTLFACSSIYCLKYTLQKRYIIHLSITIILKAFLVYPFDRVLDLLFCWPHTFSSLTYLVRTQEASTASISRLRKPPLSMTCRAWMVAPPGEHTLSLSCPGCCSESSSIRAAPFEETQRGNISLTAGRIRNIQMVDFIITDDNNCNETAR